MHYIIRLMAGLLIICSVQADTVRQVADLFPGANGSSPNEFTLYREQLYFVAQDALHGRELWRLDAAGKPELVADIRPGSIGSVPSELVEFRGKLYFKAFHPDYGAELWAYDGQTVSLQVIDILPGTQGSAPRFLAAFNEQLLFIALSPLSRMLTFFTYDGENEPRELLAGLTSPDPRFIVFQDRVYFSAADRIHGTELWVYDGENAPQLVADLLPGPSGANPFDFIVLGDQLLFFAQTGTGIGLWRYDGTEAPQLVMRIARRIEADNKNTLCVLGDYLYFAASDFAQGIELWKYNGKDAPHLVADINPGSFGSEPHNLTVYQGRIYFFASDEPIVFGAPTKLFYLDETDKPQLVAEHFRGASNPHMLMFNGKLYFVANDGDYGNELWSYDGQIAQLVADIHPGRSSSNPLRFKAFNDKLYFAAQNAPNDQELWELSPE